MVNENEDQFTFNISLSVLNHLGRNLYRSFVTVLGEAISNSWDADAKNVWIHIDKNKNSFFIKDDGVGMTKGDFQNKFLKIGYSKRNNGNLKSTKGRPFIGRKGIGKLALLSCAKQISVISKTKSTEYIGGLIDNSGLDKAIKHDLTPDKYPLAKWDKKAFTKYTNRQKQGTIIYFEDIKGGIKNSLDILKKITALYFRFSLIDKSFNIFIDGEKITYKHLSDLAQATEFLWEINYSNDLFVVKGLKSLKEKLTIKAKGKINGFIASVETPRNLNIMNIGERVSVDLFVNGRLREKNILRHIPTARIVEDYLYGQIHFDILDDKANDRFTSDREGIVANDSKFDGFLKVLKSDVLTKIINDWDELRRKHKKTGDPENKSISPKERKSGELFNVVSEEYSQPKGSKNRRKIEGWVDNLAEDAKYNFSSYAECFISENLIREYIQGEKISLSKEADIEAERCKNMEITSKGKGNISIDIRQRQDDINYLSMDYLAYLVDNKDKSNPAKGASLSRDADEYKPIRDAIMHTALLTGAAKKKLNSVYENIKARLNKLLSTN
jgi:hypothetical protein